MTRRAGSVLTGNAHLLVCDEMNGIQRTRKLIARVAITGSDCLHDAPHDLFFLAKAVKPFDVRFVPEPGQLPLCIMSDIQLGLFDGALKISPAMEQFDTRR